MVYRKSKNFLLILLSLGLAFTACTQGQQGEPAKVTVAGTETPPIDVCEKPENITNTLCQWVASEYKNSGGVTLMQYDDQGRIIVMEMKDNNGKTTMKGTLTYNEHGLATVVSNSQPDPADPQNYTEVDTITYKYDPQTSAIQQVVTDKTNKGTPTGQNFSTYVTLPNGDLGITIVEFDKNQQPVKYTLRVITKDANGKVTLMDEKVVPSMGAPPENWAITKFRYDTDTGRLIKMERSEQICLVRTCIDPATSTILANIDPTGIQTFAFNYDDQGRRSAIITTGEGEIDYSTKPPTVKTNPGVAPDPDVTQTCELHHEIHTQAKILGEHPLEFFMATLGQIGFHMGFSDLDMFTSMSCTVSPPPAQATSSGDFTFKWVRFWETQPEGKPPGS